MDFTGYEKVGPSTNNVGTVDFTNYEKVKPKNTSPKSWLEIIREGLSGVTGPTQRQLEENPPTPLKPDAGYLDRVSAAQGILPKAFTSPLNLPTAPQAESTLGQIGSGLYNVAAKGVVEPLVSPGGLALGALGGLSSARMAPYLSEGVASKAALANRGVLGVLGGVLGPQAIGTIVDAFSAPTLQRGIEEGVGGGLLGLGSVLGLKAGMTPRPVAKPVEIIPKARQLPENFDLPSSGNVYEMPSAKPTLQLQDKQPIEVQTVNLPENIPLPDRPNELLRARIMNPDILNAIRAKPLVTPELPRAIKTDVGGGKLGFAGKSAEEVSLPLKESPVKEEGYLGKPYEQPTAPARFLGTQETTEAGKGIDLYNLESDIPGIGKSGSTVVGSKLTEAGYKLPEKIPILETAAEKQGKIPSAPVEEPVSSIPVTKEVEPLTAPPHPLDNIKPEDIVTVEETTTKESYAPQPKEPLIQEHPRIPSRENLPENLSEVRKEDSGQTSSSGGVFGKGEEGGLPKGETITTKLTKNDAQEVLHKIGILKDEPDLLADYNLTQAQVNKLYDSIPKDGGEWKISKEHIEAIKGELADHANVLRDIANDAYNAGETGQSLRINKQAKKFESGLNIKLGNQSELGGIDLSTIHDFARGIIDNVKTLAEFTAKFLKEFPSLTAEFARTTWNKLRADRLDAPGLTSAVTHLQNTPGKQGEALAEGAINAYNTARELRGKLVEEPIRALKDLFPAKGPLDVIQNNRESLRRIMQYMDDMYDNGSTTIKPTPKEQQGIDIITKKNVEIRNEINKRISANPNSSLHGGAVNNLYIEQGFSPDVVETITNKPESASGKQLIKDFEDYRTSRGQTPAEAIKDLGIIKAGFSKQFSHAAEQFGPFDKAAGKGIPPSWRSKNLLDRIKNYGTRGASRLAYHDTIETVPSVQSALNDPKSGLSANKYWKAVLRELSQQKEYHEIVATSLVGAGKAGVTGTATGLVNLASGFITGLPQYTWKQMLISSLRSFSEYKKNQERALSQGTIRENLSSFESGEGGLTDLVKGINRTRDIGNAIQGKNLLERISRTLTFAPGRINTIENFSARVAKTSSKTQERWLEKYGKNENLSQYEKQGFLPEEVINRMAAKFSESVQGGYDLRTLPVWVQEGWAAPILSLSRWPIDRTNRFIHEVVTPLSNGDIHPALKATVGAIIGANVIDQLRQSLSKRRNPVPTMDELKAGTEQEGGKINKELLFYKLAAMNSMAGLTGAYGDILKTIGDVWHGNRVQDVNNPGLKLLDTVATRTAQIMKAHAEGDLSIEDVPDAISRILEDTVQTYRTILANFSTKKQEEISRSNKFKDLRVFKQVTGAPTENLGGDFVDNPFIDKDIKEYKKTPSIDRALELMPKIGDKVFAKNLNHPERAIKKLESLKQNSYQTFPSLEDSPEEFSRYLDYLEKTKGKKKAMEMLDDYNMQSEINKEKSRFIPKL